jgi:hypothetical protein
MGTDWVCPRCGSSGVGNQFCGGCGLDLTDQYELPSRAEWEARQSLQVGNPDGVAASTVIDRPPAVSPATENSSPARPSDPSRIDPAQGLWSTIGVVLALVGAALVFASSFLHWVSAFGETATFWQLTDAFDILLTLVVVGVAATTAVVLGWGRLRAARFAALALAAGLVAMMFVNSIEFLVLSEDEVSTVQAGEIVALTGCVLLIGAVVLQATYPLIELPKGRPGPPLLVAGLAMLAFVGLADPLVALLPVDNGVSAWEAAKAADIIGTVIDVALVAVAITAIFVRDSRLIIAAFALGSYNAIGNLAGSIDSLAGEADGAAVFLSLFVIAPTAAAGAILLAVTCARRNPAAL